MDIQRFEDLRKQTNALHILQAFILFEDLELWNKNTDVSKYYNTLDEFYNDIYLGKTFREHLEEMEDITLTLNGGRGANSSSSGKIPMTKIPRANGRNRESFKKWDFPARLNTGLSARSRNQEQMIDRFTSMYGKTDHEYAAYIDENGFASQLVEGGRGAVTPEINPNATRPGKNAIIIHNHPSDGEPHFSVEDLEFAAVAKTTKGIIATSDRGTFIFRKTAKFKSKGFQKALAKAEFPTGMNYNDGFDFWLKQNAKKYGFSYQAKGWKPSKEADKLTNEYNKQQNSKTKKTSKTKKK